MRTDTRGAIPPGALVAASVAVLIAGAGHDAGARRNAHGRTLLVVGDSLAVGTRPYVKRFLHGWRVRQVTSISMHAPEGPRVMRRYRRHLARVVFVNLGTNDDPRGVRAFLHSLRRVMRIAGPHRCVVWATIYRPPVGGASYARMNRAPAGRARPRGRLIVFRGARRARAHRYWFGSDHVHPTATGYRVRARAMSHSIRVCRKIALRR